MTTKTVFQELQKKRKLPTPSGVALQVIQQCNNENISLGEIAQVIKADPALSAKLIQYANSEFIPNNIRVASVEKATIQLGMKSVVNLALGFSLLSDSKKGLCTSFDYGKFWSSSLLRAISAKNITLYNKDYDADELFICGLLAQIGKLALATIYPNEYSKLLNSNPPEVYKDREKELFGINSGELTRHMFEDWKLPPGYGEAAEKHEEFFLYSDDEEIINIDPIAILGLAKQIDNLCQSSPAASKLLEVEQFATRLYINAEKFETLYNDSISQWQEWGKTVQIPTKQCRPYHELKEINSEQESGSSNNTEPFRILIADDEPITLLSLKALLSKTPGVTIDEAADGEEALKKIKTNPTDLLITDWKMPKLSGIDLCKLLRETELTHHIYIIVLTTCENDADIIQAFEAGADDFVTKPFTPQVLAARIKAGRRIIHYQRKITRDREVIQDYVAKLARANRKLQQLAMTDPLTDLPNRRHAIKRLKEYLTEAIRHNEPLSCIIIDLDDFKKINDQYGHNIGDLALQEIAYVFKKAARSYDTICRLGGEEFIVMSVRNSLEDTQKFAERLRQDIENHPIHAEGHIINITASMGIAQRWHGMADGKELIHQADKALYKAKKAGKNRVETISVPTPNNEK